MKTKAMLDAYPGEITLDRGLLVRAIESLGSCAQACTACADACLSEEMVADLRACITSDLDCADSCGATLRILSRHGGYDASVTRAHLEACIAACRACGDECAQHAGMHEHCRVCAEACRECEAACRELLDAFA
ncbi:four-helix bundle copper-binding protein [Cellulomonas cellasea]|uniref:four-helix bundle copper-binding protein n=1 Tax=Cellulomonas cellasea TaxID=43670 RepID=UPI0025A3CEEC|nr:four-helix bundle copper-binding protein [Cellulomonas cellasea]MDM8085287.1 four-helix bundle copper-binding protein [Cellulomonas cellasea]